MTWLPATGARFNRFISEQPEEARDSITLSSKKILARCRDPKAVSTMSTHLIVGEVQSGKTMSFTGVTALARDNGFPIIVVIGGTKDNLLKQTIHRLNKDLHVGGDGGANPWLLKSGAELNSDKIEVSQILNQWSDNNLPDSFKRTLIVTTLKTKGSLDKVTKGLKALDLPKIEELPVLIIDDEADQAGLNIAEQVDDESTVYAALGRLRKVVPNNDYLMYTATPQATLLLHIADHLSPETVTVLASGPDYIGGRDLFGDGRTYAQTIPPQDVNQATNPQPHVGPPASLKAALSHFLVGLAIGQMRGMPQPSSMLIHPGTTKALHTQHEKWVNAILQIWKTMLKDPTDAAFTDCLNSDFAEALSRIENMSDLDAIWPAVSIEARFKDILLHISHWIPQVEVRIVNSEKAAANIAAAEWKSHPGWIVIGGAKLERGFTIENLIVTYMPRGAGTGLADSIQQRGRFFGYKRKYGDLLMGWFASDVAEAFTAYIDHEDSIRGQLADLDKNDLPVKSWRRKFFLDPSLKATRAQVIKLSIRHDKFIKGFIYRQRMLFSDTLIPTQDEVLRRFKAEMIGSTKHPVDTRINPEDSGHVRKSLPLASAIDLLVDVPAVGEERELMDTRLFALQRIVDDAPDSMSELVFVSSLEPRIRSIAGRTTDFEHVELAAIDNLMVGKSANYAGDEKLVSDDLITIQVHLITPHIDSNYFPNAIAVAIHWPAGMDEGVVWELKGQR
jgi:hypothetical protein